MQGTHAALTGTPAATAGHSYTAINVFGGNVHLGDSYSHTTNGSLQSPFLMADTNSHGITKG